MMTIDTAKTIIVDGKVMKDVYGMGRVYKDMAELQAKVRESRAYCDQYYAEVGDQSKRLMAHDAEISDLKREIERMNRVVAAWQKKHRDMRGMVDGLTAWKRDHPLGPFLLKSDVMELFNDQLEDES